MTMSMRNPKAEELWYRITIREKVQLLTADYRKKLGIPTGGFKTTSRAKIFLENLSKNDKHFQLYNEYIGECKKDIYIPTQFFFTLANYLVSGKANVGQINVSGVELDTSEYLESGMIKIRFGLNATIKDLKKFVDEKSWHLRLLQDHYRGQHKLKKSKKIRTSNNFIRDEVIYYLASKYNKKELLDLLRKQQPDDARGSHYKEGIIQLMLKEGLDIDTDIDVIKTVIARQKKLRKAS